MRERELVEGSSRGVAQPDQAYLQWRLQTEADDCGVCRACSRPESEARAGNVGRRAISEIVLSRATASLCKPLVE